MVELTVILGTIGKYFFSSLNIVFVFDFVSWNLILQCFVFYVSIQS